jgi:hypothetical protein
MKLDLADLSNRQTAGKLAGYGVRYIVVHAGTPGGQPAQLHERGYRLIVASGSGSLWRVTSRPAPTSVDARSGFDWNYGFPSYDWRLLRGHGTLEASTRGCLQCTGTVSFIARAVGRSVHLRVSESDTEAPLASLEIPLHSSVRVQVPGVKLMRGSSRLALATSTGEAHPGKLIIRGAELTLNEAGDDHAH